MTERPILLDGVSRTAILIAQARASETRRADRLFADPLAEALVRRAGAYATPSAPGRQSQDHFVLRTRYFDDHLLAASAAGCRQAVLLAAGLDTRAFRLALPAETHLFELDLPDLLAFKQRALDAERARPSCARTVLAADLRADWGAPLLASGFDPQRPTAWLAEGVLSFLTERDNERIMRRITGLSAPGSRLGLEHLNGAFQRLPGLRWAQRRLTESGSGWRSAVDDPVGWLARHGWRATVSHPAEVAACHGRPIAPQYDPEQVGAARAWLVSAEVVAR
ncbi:SAM-dependent methyltransferase [Thermomonospora umbrina]|uniref:S-adenosyl-L-methionine-dependent methyltransferase n=1 Tax=Thermomonospora umbrina TaxID=111806 RepID=A0A3D9SX60_9ACTN|nr:SAM-dependent methyltransferase [Thermomonospora umbrina]REE97585.1 methyltransferase (TIGR00027 family) [Thermomonospora umbrina]